MIEEHDEKTIRCRRLGHDVSFRYCRNEAGQTPCRLAMDCWWEQFDVQTYLSAHFTPEVVRSLHISATPPKMVSILSLIHQARQRMEKE